MAGETATKTTIILSTSSDWREWIEITKTAAEGLGVWDYMDPDTDTDHISTLHTPIEPQPVDINSQKFTITQLSETEQKQLRLLKKDYRDDLREYKERQKAIGQIRTPIQETISRTNLRYTLYVDCMIFLTLESNRARVPVKRGGPAHQGKKPPQKEHRPEPEGQDARATEPAASAPDSQTPLPRARCQTPKKPDATSKVARHEISQSRATGRPLSTPGNLWKYRRIKHGGRSKDSETTKRTHRYNLEERKSARTPLPTFNDTLSKYEDKASAQDIHLYQQKVGSIQYATTITRPDAAKASSKLAEHLLNPSPAHMDAADRVISYLYGTRTLAIEYSPGGANCEFSSDAAFADTEDRKSSEGYLFKMFGGAVDWRASKQKTVTTSTTEAKLLAISNAARETYWWKRFFKDVGLELDSTKPTILCDNAQTVGLIEKEEPNLKTRLRHVDIHHHWVRQESQNNNIHVQWTPTSQMPADGLTKALVYQKHNQFIQMLGLVNIRNKINTTQES